MRVKKRGVVTWANLHQWRVWGRSRGLEMRRWVGESLLRLAGQSRGRCLRGKKQEQELLGPGEPTYRQLAAAHSPACPVAPCTEGLAGAQCRAQPLHHLYLLSVPRAGGQAYWGWGDQLPGTVSSLALGIQVALPLVG